MDWMDAGLFFVGFFIAYLIGYWFGKRRGFVFGEMAALLEVEDLIDEAIGESEIEKKVRSSEQRKRAPWQ
jgi:hypothetical protein